MKSMLTRKLFGQSVGPRIPKWSKSQAPSRLFHLVRLIFLSLWLFPVATTGFDLDICVYVGLDLLGFVGLSFSPQLSNREPTQMKFHRLI